MKISIGANIFDKPWGGGNLFFKNFTTHFNDLNYEVVNDLTHDDIDIILLTDPRKDSQSSSFTHKDIKHYLKYINNNALVIQRINECDERKLTKGLNDFYMKANEIADHTVFVSTWISNIYKNLGMDKEKFTVILGGGDSSVFNFKNKKKWNKNEKLKLVTHHWSSNKNKGFEVYSKLDSILNKNPYKNTVEFTYIGNFTKEHNFKNIKFIPPLHGNLLANELKKHHIYITASINEPSGNHHIEAAQTRLPILYMNSGGIPEYCSGFGVEFDKNNIEDKLVELMKDYDFYFEELKHYQINNENMMEQYSQLFSQMITKRDSYIKNRKIKISKNLLLKNSYKIVFKIKKINNNLRVNNS